MKIVFNTVKLNQLPLFELGDVITVDVRGDTKALLVTLIVAHAGNEVGLINLETGRPGIYAVGLLELREKAMRMYRNIVVYGKQDYELVLQKVTV